MYTARTHKKAFELEIGESVLVRIFKKDTLRKAKRALYEHTRRNPKVFKWEVIGGGLLVRREK